MSDSKQQIHIHLTIEIPSCATSIVSSPEGLKKGDNKVGITSSSPVTGKPKKLEVGNAVLYAHVVFSTAVTAVWAQIYKDPVAGAGPFPGVPDTGLATLARQGSLSSGNTVADWNTNISGLPNADHDALGTVKNKFVVWFQVPTDEPAGEWEMSIITFYGQNA